MARAKRECRPEEVKGTHRSKALSIDAIAQRRKRHAQIKKEKERCQHLLKETETTMKFGLFCMVQGYLHAMTLVKREKEAWSGKGGLTGREINPGGSAGSKQERIPTTVERKNMIQEEVKARERVAARMKFMERARKAEARRELRDSKNKRSKSQRGVMMIRAMKAKEIAARDIQRAFRGSRGRMYASRRALKNVGMEALKCVLHEATAKIQRVYRGHLGRVEASEVRKELAEYIAHIRVKEAKSDLEEYREGHKIDMINHQVKEKLSKIVGKALSAMRWKKLD